MNEDVADGLLLDIRAVSLDDLLTEADDSALSKALERLLSSKPSSNNFHSSI
jgi:FXSXX-COOH protein